MSTLYEALGLPRGADERQIKDAYRSLARRFHPDLNGGDAVGAGRLAEINRAYATLGNTQARAAYDRDLAQRRAELHRRLLAFAASGVLSFVVTAVVVAAMIGRDVQPPPGAEAPSARTNDNASTLAQSRMPGSLPVDGASLAGPRDHVRAAIWQTYRDARFDFALRYPAGIFAFEPTRSDAHVNTFVSLDGHAILRIVAAENTTGITLGSYRSMLMKDRYAGASFKPAARHEHWFVLSGTLRRRGVPGARHLLLRRQLHARLADALPVEPECHLRRARQAHPAQPPARQRPRCRLRGGGGQAQAAGTPQARLG